MAAVDAQALRKAEDTAVREARGEVHLFFFLPPLSHLLTKFHSIRARSLVRKGNEVRYVNLNEKLPVRKCWRESERRSQIQLQED